MRPGRAGTGTWFGTTTTRQPAAPAEVPTGEDRWQVIGRELHLRYADGAGRAQLKEAQLARVLGRIPTTARNLNTVRKLIDLAGS